MKALETIQISCRWNEEIRCFELSGSTHPSSWVSPLLAWHEETFYGTMIDIEDDIVRLSPWQALTLFALRPHSRFSVIEWADEFTARLEEWARHIWNGLGERRFLPDASLWKSTGGAWSEAGRTRWRGADDDPDPFVATWRSLAVADWLSRDPELRGIWGEIVRTYPLIASPSGQWTGTEDDWLEQIGWLGDRPPFTVGLRLVEPPEDGDAWTLEAVFIAIDDSVIASARDIPRAWRPYESSIQRAIRRICAIVPWLDAGEGLRTELSNEEAWRFLSEDSLKLTEAGVRLLLPDWWHDIRQAQLSIKAKLSPSVNAESLFGLERLADFDWRVATNGIELTEEEFAALAEQKRRLIRLRGQWLILDPALVRRAQALMEKAKKEGVPIHDIVAQTLLSEAEEREEATDESIPIHIDVHDQFRAFIRQLQQLDGLPKANVPPSFRGTLRPYQQRGVDWLVFLRRFGFGACLADDMGLGKTVQLLAYLAHVKEIERPDTPALLICPTSVIGNWQKECARFTPDLRVYVHHGPNRAKNDAFVQTAGEADLVITSYNLAHLDQDDLKQIHWHAICLDEAQNIKNAQTKQARAIRRLSGKHKIALSGTPVENRLGELWSIFHFLNPGYLGSRAEFERRFAGPIEKEGDARKKAALQALIRPFLLRRTKTDEAVALNLPDKLEQKEYCPLTAEQAALYEQLVNDTLERAKEASPFARRGLILQMLNGVKQICDHPALYLKERRPRQLVERSHKLEKLIELIEQIRANDESCLIFTQYVRMGEMIQQLLSDLFDEPVLFLHGGVPKQTRDRMVDEFQAKKAPIFLLSLKAGGTGLNLTAANHVIHFDRWWNPAVENQATDRAYRIGQTKFVHVHKLITVGTIEEKIDEMLEQKQALADIITEGEAWITELSDDELRDLLALSAAAKGGA
ncbi:MULTISPECIES: DEAD/DEAH box helicase [Geobacillus]|uniref:ATP-dependent helicase n=2 Tax=Geobacillus thermoleovorans group TaxID=1505648 RepID=A0A2Z3N7H8_GEOTH|nr:MULTISPECIES: DEAD/DEAH box helicase [Geobacillus]AWO74595.1 ATP-dependent helicase [Geobacillus thermoleovorans]MBW7644630.1 DEAD/DEAH box helicase [Geobacillus thermoleovorans]MED3722530.1 DEAD/DEAH box helicase [Geobacillus stearothermophilus]MED3748609.1 DEAD/DEAH box helicase [Geobacillus stearothermophilus]MED3754323.1 DEAD/DEAH box helicase [Geobacillus stearothermophilus]